MPCSLVRPSGDQLQIRGVAFARYHVRFGSKADMCSAQADVRFVPEADICSAKNHMQMRISRTIFDGVFF